MSGCCPTCGATLLVEDAEADMNPMQRRLVRLVRAAGREGISTEALTERLYVGRRDGGPTSAAGRIRQLMLEVNRLLAPHGLRVVSRPRGGLHARRFLARVAPGTYAPKPDSTRIPEDVRRAILADLGSHAGVAARHGISYSSVRRVRRAARLEKQETLRAET